MFKIEKGIPVPKAQPQTKYPFDDLDVGDSFFVPGKRPVQLSGSLVCAKNRTGYKFTMRKVDGGARVWRVE